MAVSRAPRIRDRETGFVLAGLLVLLVALVVIGMGFYALAHHEIRSSQVNVESQQAFWLAEAGKERTVRSMEAAFRPPDVDEWAFTDEPGPNGGAYSVKVHVDPLALFNPVKEFVLESIGTVDGKSRRILQRVRLESFAKYAYFTDEERSPGGSPIWFVTEDRIEGPVHSNGTFRILGNPTFLGKVTTASDHMIAYKDLVVDDPGDWPIGGNAPYFGAGLEIGVPIIPLPTETGDIRVEAQAGGVYLDYPAEIEIGKSGQDAGIPADGWFRFREVGGCDTCWTSQAIDAMPVKVVYADGEIRASGTLTGELTLSGSGNIRIVDDLVYRCSDAAGTPSPGCTDLMGLVAERNIIFEDNAANGDDLIVDAVLMALDTSITAENHSTGPTRGVLTIWGGLIQRYRGPVGTTSGGHITHGYEKNYHYDTRVTARTPPMFPLRGTYEGVLWTETWSDAPLF